MADVSGEVERNEAAGGVGAAQVGGPVEPLAHAEPESPQEKPRGAGRDVDVTRGNIWKCVIAYVLPLMAASLFQQLYTVVDAWVVGNFVSSTALGAIDSTNSVVRLLVNFFVGLSTGASIVVAQLWGAKKDREVGGAVHAAFMFSVGCGIVVTVLGLALSYPLLKLLNTPAENWDAAFTFIMIYFGGMVPLMTYNMCAAVLRAVGDSKGPFVFIAVSTVVNIVLDLLFVVVFHWGVAGAAVATVISEAVSCVLAVRALMRYDGACRLDLKRGLKVDWRVLKRMVGLGLPTGVGSALYPVSNATVQWGVNGLGSLYVTGWALTGKVDLLVCLVLDSFGVASTTFVAQCYGAGKNRRARKSVLVCMVLATAMLVPLCALLYFWGSFVAGFFAPEDADALAVCDQIFKFLAPWYATFVVVEVLAGSIRGAGETVWPMLITLVGTCILRIAWMMLVVPHHWDVLWVAAVYPISWVITGLAFVAYWRFGSWRTRLYAEDAA